MTATGFRIARPVPSARGGWTLDGWEAWTRLSGAPDESRLQEVVSAGAAFHEAVAHLPRPGFLDLADDPWCQGDRIAWQEQPLPSGTMLARLAAAFQPVSAPSQVIHGDLLGNVLFTPEQAPAIIDWAPYWRPAGLGAAIAAVDAACWHGFPVEGLAQVGAATPEWPQLLVRALAFRVATWHLLDRWGEPMAAHHEPAATAVLRLTWG